MSENKHVFKIVPGKVLNEIKGVELFLHELGNTKPYAPHKINKVNFIALDDRHDIKLERPVEFFRFMNVTTDGSGFSCIQEKEDELSYCKLPCTSSIINIINTHNLEIKLKEISPVAGNKRYLLEPVLKVIKQLIWQA